MDKIVELIESSVSLSSKQFQSVLEIVANNRAAIRGITELLEGVPDIDTEKLDEIVADLDAFDDELDKRAAAATPT